VHRHGVEQNIESYGCSEWVKQMTNVGGVLGFLAGLTQKDYGFFYCNRDNEGHIAENRARGARYALEEFYGQGTLAAITNIIEGSWQGFTNSIKNFPEALSLAYDINLNYSSGKISRRDFLKLGSCSLASLAFVPLLMPSNDPCFNNNSSAPEASPIPFYIPGGPEDTDKQLPTETPFPPTAIPSATAFPTLPPPTTLPTETAIPDYTGLIINAEVNGKIYPIVQQPANRGGYISSELGELTQFRMAANYGNIGLLAHNYVYEQPFTGLDFFYFQKGDKVNIYYENGSIERFVITEKLEYQALQPKSPFSQFRSLEDDTILTVEQMFKRVYMGDRHVTFQTCILENGEVSWGRLFVIATPYNGNIQ